jgi:hypothetical protein
VDRKPELRLPTVNVAVRLSLVGREPANAELFVTAAARGRHEAVAELLEEPDEFVPVQRAAGVRLLAKRAIAWLAIQRTPVSADSSEVITLYDRQHHVTVELMSGGALEGMLFDSMPSDRPRAIDHLNRSGRFLRLWTSDEHYLINKDHILQVLEQE